MMSSVWSVHCNSSDRTYRSQYAYSEKGLSSGLAVRPTTLLRKRRRHREKAWIQMRATDNFTRCNGVSPVASYGRERQDQLWKNFFQDHTRWRDNRHRKRSFRSPDFRHKETPRPNSFYKPAWVDVQLATPDARINYSASSALRWRLSSDHADQVVGPGFDDRLTPEYVKKLCQHGQVMRAVATLEFLLGMNYTVDKYIFYAVLKECSIRKSLALGVQVHALAVRAGYASDKFLCNHFIRMYAGQGKLEEAMDVFRGVAVPDAFMWSSIITAHVKQGQAERAIELYQHMRAARIKPDGHVLAAALQACAAAGDLRSGKQVHDDVSSIGMEHDMFLCNCLVDMYVKCGSIQDARVVFDGLVEKNVVTWTAMISGYAKVESMRQEALNLYSSMHNEGIVIPDTVTFVCLLQVCASVGVSALEKGKQLHSELEKRGLKLDAVLGTNLVSMYTKCGSLKDARMVFDKLCEKNLVTWTAMIAGYAQQPGMGQEALNIYSTMCNEGMAIPDTVTFVCLLQACANVGVSALEHGKQLHLELQKRKLEADVVMGGSVVNMYAKCGSLEDARVVFDRLVEKNVVTWNSMIAGFAQQEGMGQEALNIYTAMHNEGMVSPNAVTFVCLLQACANVGVSAIEKGKQLHSQIKDRSLEFDTVVGGSLVNMYAKCGSLKDARAVFDGLGQKSVVTWNAMISGYAQQEGMGQEALSIYGAMQHEGVVAPTAVTYACLLEACGSVGALQQGKQLHSEICVKGFECNEAVATCLVKMYAKCGRLEDCREIFDRLPVKSLETWTALLKGYAEHGEGGMAIQCFEELLEHGIQPNEVTYICLLTACSHAGLVDQGQEYLDTMQEQHGVKPNVWHYTCLVDLLGRAGHLDRAEAMLRTSGLAGQAVSWTALLTACKSYGDAELGRRCFEHLVRLEPTMATAYMLLASIYANAGRWDEVDKLESRRRAAGARKKAAKACIEVNREVHEFTVGEERSDVAATLRKMNTRVREGGHVPQTQVVLRAVSEQAKEDALCGHAEKLAMAYGLLNTPAGSTLVVTKNLRMCIDCHSSTKVMSKLEKRDIVVRDGHKVHRFQNGACSCQDRP